LESLSAYARRDDAGINAIINTYEGTICIKPANSNNVAVNTHLNRIKILVSVNFTRRQTDSQT